MGQGYFWITFNEKFNGDLQFILELGLQGNFKVKFVFLNWEPYFWHLQTKAWQIVRLNMYSGHWSGVPAQYIGVTSNQKSNCDLQFEIECDLQGHFRVNFMFFTSCVAQEQRLGRSKIYSLWGAGFTWVPSPLTFSN